MTTSSGKRRLVARAVLVIAGAICCAAAPSAGPRTTSDIKGASLVAIGTLPRSPETGALDDYCTEYRAKSVSALGKQVEAQGWIVTSEAPLGRYRVVSFASGFDPATSALCFARNANVGVFDGDRLIALAYKARGSKAGPLGVVEPLENGALLVWTDPPGAPVGELHAERGALRLTAVSAERTFCHGRAVVPNVYGKPIDAARKVLIAHGWRAVRSQEAVSEYDEARAFRKRGVIEADACSGTGVGYCRFSYHGPAGGLRVITVGDDHTVANDGVTCRS